jgi:hypothetical protein
MKTNTLLILSIVLLAFSSTAVAGKLYKWVDENGNISFSDKIQPKDSRLEREELNEKGRTIAVKDAAKTPEELQQFKRIKNLQVTQAGLLEEQQSEDAALLKTFQSADDIEALAKSKSDMLDSHMKISSGQSEILKKQLISHQKAAAKFEREGKKIPAKTVSNIKLSQNQYDKNQSEIAEFSSQKEELAKQTAEDKKRFNILSSQSSEKPSIHNETIPKLTLGELTCNQVTCDTLWERAHTYIAQQKTKIIFTSNKLVLTKTPKLSKDIGLTLTRVNAENGSTILLDIRCADSKGGKETCKGKQTAKIIAGFNRLAD